MAKPMVRNQAPRRGVAGICALAAVILGQVLLSSSRADDAGIEFFEKKVRPVLVAHCYECHATDSKRVEGGLLLDSRGGVLAGGETGPAIKPGEPDASLLIKAIRFDDDSLQMPPNGKLPAAVIADLEAWVKRGAPDPRVDPPKVAKGATWDEIVGERRRWWSLQPVRVPAVPRPKDAGWSSHPIDRFVLAALEERGLRPAAPADVRTLARRLSLTLVGLPPSPDDVARFVAECERAGLHPGEPLPAAAVERYVDSLLGSPHFGERWARHWMDVVRFSETHGNEWNYEVHFAWRYRDYLIRAFNADVPFDQLIREHVAGDLLPSPRWNEAERFNESVIGTAFYRFGEVNHDDCIGLPQIGYDLADNQLDTLTKAFLGMTVACARCHDHKLDAVSTRDYHGLLGVLRSSRMVSHTLDAPDVNAATMARLDERKQAIRDELAAVWLDDAKSLERFMSAAIAKKAGRPEATQQAVGLDAKRLELWIAALGDEKSPLEQPVAPIRLLAAAMTAGATNEKPPFADAWKQVAAQFAREDDERTKHNAGDFETLADFRAGEWPDAATWQVGGHGLRGNPSGSGDFALASTGDAAVTSVLPAGAFTHRTSDRLNGTLRSAVLATSKKQISFHVMGERSAAVRLVSNNCQLNYKNYRALTSSEPQWITFSLPDGLAGLRVYAELMTKFDNPKFPDQLAALGGDKQNYRIPWDDAAKDARSHFGVTRVVLHDGPAPRPGLSHLRPLFAGDASASADGFATRWAAAATRAIEAWRKDAATDDDVRWIDGLLQRSLLTNRADASPRLASLIAEYRSLEAELSPPRIAPGVADFGPGFDQPVFVRGDCLRPGEPAPRRFVSVLGRDDARLASTGSGRLQLAERIADPNNPLTARVMANRVWHHLFGAGLVRTVDDLGHAGELPSHPELLDWLASEFVEVDEVANSPFSRGPEGRAEGDRASPRDGSPNSSGRDLAGRAPLAGSRPHPQSAIRNPQSRTWSVKRLIRTIVLSRAFQMSHAGAPAAAEADPLNRLLHRYPARRMEAEAIRDSILFASGRLDRTPFGPSVAAFREKDDEYRRLFRGPLDGHGRRSVYVKCSLMEVPAFLGAFNLPGGKVTQGRRDATNVPEQALALLNDPFVLQQADVWGTRLAARGAETPAARIDAMLVAALGRPASGDERARFERFVAELASLHGVPDEEAAANSAVWRDAAHSVFNLREFTTIP